MNLLHLGLLLTTLAGGVGAHSLAPDLSSNPAPVRGELDPALPTVFIAGDSTAARSGADDQQGWGEPFKTLLDPARVNVANRARGGRSSRTFITEGLWAQLLADVKPGDVVLIQFGHNDGGAINAEPPGSTRPVRARGSLPGVGEETEAIDHVLTGQPERVRTFGSYLRQMIRETRAAGAVPIVLSTTVRAIWRDGRIERGTGCYPEWSRQVAAGEGVLFVPLSDHLAETYERMGPEAVAVFFPRDHTHMRPEGAALVARHVARALRELTPATLAPLWVPPTS